MDRGTLDLLQERLKVRIVMTRGRLYVRLALYGGDVVSLDKVVRLVDHPKVNVSRTATGYPQVLVQSQAGVVKFCDVALPHLHEGDPLHSELVLARATADAEWYDRYEILKEFLEEE